MPPKIHAELGQVLNNIAAKPADAAKLAGPALEQINAAIGGETPADAPAPSTLQDAVNEGFTCLRRDDLHGLRIILAGIGKKPASAPKGRGKGKAAEPEPEE